MASKRRRGRPRKTGARHKSGHLKRTAADPNDSPRAIAARMPHRRSLGELALDPRAETALGRLFLQELISEPQLTAGEVYARMWRGYVSTLNAPGTPGEAQGRVSACGGCPSPEDRKYCLCDLRRRIYAEATEVLTSTGRGVAPLVRVVVIYDQFFPFGDLELLKLGLGALARHYGLESAPKSAYPKKHAPEHVRR